MSVIISTTELKHSIGYTTSTIYYFNIFDSCKISLTCLKKASQSKLHAVLEPFGLYAWFLSLLKGDTLMFVSTVRITVSLTDIE